MDRSAPPSPLFPPAHGASRTLKGPDFFIVGAPKCGTTAMTDYLAQHPQVGMCARKETQFFATDLYPKFGREEGSPWIGQDGYLRLFTAAQEKGRIGEASVRYLYSSAAPHAIKEFSPEADIIAMLRNPFEALPSLHLPVRLRRVRACGGLRTSPGA